MADAQFPPLEQIEDPQPRPVGERPENPLRVGLFQLGLHIRLYEYIGYRPAGQEPPFGRGEKKFRRPSAAPALFAHAPEVGYNAAMADALRREPRRRWFRLTPGGFVLGLLAVEGVLLLSQQFDRFALNKGYSALIAMATAAAIILFMLLSFLAALLFRLRFQYSIGSMLVADRGRRHPLPPGWRW